MSIIKPQSNYLKIGVNCESGDVIKFLDEGNYNEEGKFPSWEFKVAVSDGTTKERKEDKLFSLNNANIKSISDAYGEESSNWKGKTMIIKEVLVNTQSGEKPAIRLRAPSGVNPVEEGNDALADAQSFEDEVGE